MMFSNGSFLDRYDAGEFDNKKSSSLAQDPAHDPLLLDPNPTRPNDILANLSDSEDKKGKKSNSSSQNKKKNKKKALDDLPYDPDFDDNLDDAEHHVDIDGSWPSAPPIEYFDAIKGYEGVSFDASNVPPPPPPPPDEEVDADGHPVKAEPPPPPPPIIILDCDHKISDEDAKSALLSYLADHCCYGKSAAKNMNVKKMEFTPAYHYELQTYAQKRETAWTYSSLKSGLADSTGYRGVPGGVPPLPWELEEFPTQPFKDEVRLMAVPNTSSVKSCHRCRGTGGVVCRDCNGKGWSRCIHCHGDGFMGDSMRERCFYCHHSKHGHGQQDCTKCNTKGKVNCAMCEGNGQIRCYIQLSITWKVYTLEHITEKLDLPKELIRDVSGQVAFEEEAERVKPIENVDEEDIKQASQKLVANHDNAFADQKIVCQRHQIRIVPITKVTYEWKGKLHYFFVYGYENKIYMKNYPQKCCWGCNLL